MSLGSPTNFVRPKGLDRRLKGELGGADIIKNARWDNETGWRFDRGIEPWWMPTSTFTFADSNIYRLNTPVDALFVWTKQNTEQLYFFVEQNGVLGYFLGNKNGGSYHNDFVSLATGRHIPSANEPGTQFIPYGNRLLIINGYDQPLLFSGDGYARPFSFTLPTPTVEVIETDPVYWDTGELTDGALSPQFVNDSSLGLGDPDGRSAYQWYLSFITDTGSESPLSSPFFADWKPATTAAEGKYGVILADVPRGPKGTVARRIYRTKNIRAGETGGLAYFIKQLNENSSTFYIDIISDNSLVDEASNDSVAISTGWQFGCAWNNRIWLGGGSVNPTKLIYSEAGKPEQFGGFNFFELGSSVGGAITGMVPYYNNLIVFRQRSLDVIRVNGGSFTVSQLTPEIGSEATNTIKLVPGIGLVFLANDGIYALRGGMDGGSSIAVEKLSLLVEKELKRINKACMAKATAVYSSKEREYWIHYPIDGDSFNSRGLVLHQDSALWSNRYHEDKTMSSFTCLTTDTQGNILIGIKPTWSATPTEAAAYSFLPALIHVWSGAPYWGKKLTRNTAGQGLYTYNLVENATPNYIYESNWIDFTNQPNKNRVLSVEVELISYGNMDITLSYGTDGGYSLEDAGAQAMVRPEILASANEETCFGSTNTNPLYPTSVIQDGKVIRLRWDVSTKLVETFKFKLTAANQFLLLGYNLYMNGQEQKALNQRAGR